MKKEIAIVGVAVLCACGTTDEFAEEDFGTLDADADGFLDEREFSDGVEDFDLFDRWDANKDGIIDRAEFEAGVAELEGVEVGAFEDWDEDDNRVVSEGEFNAAVFDAFDQNDDQRIDRSEFAAGSGAGFFF